MSETKRLALRTLLIVVGIVMGQGDSKVWSQNDPRMHVDANGKPTTNRESYTGVYRKVIVKGASAPLYKDATTMKHEVVAPGYAVFHQLWVDSSKYDASKGAPEDTDASITKNGRVRVGYRDGDELGWLDIDQCLTWNTNTSLDQKADRDFVVTLANEDKVSLSEKVLGPSIKTLVLLENPPVNRENPTFNVIIYFSPADVNAPAKPAAVLQRKLKLEIMFVIDTTSSMVEVLKGTKEVINRCAEKVGNYALLKDRIRFGLVTYQDKVPGLTPARMVSKLTSDMAAFQRSVTGLSVGTVGSDGIDEDVVAGLKMALEDSGWEQDSVKCVIVLGDASAHDKGDTKNSTGLSLDDMLISANGEGGGDLQKLLNTKSFSVVRALQPIEPGFPEDYIRQLEIDAERCERQFKMLAENKGEVQGKYLSLNPKKQNEVDDTVKKLSDWLTGNFDKLNKLASGQNITSGGPSVVAPKSLGSADPIEATLQKIASILDAEQKARFLESRKAIFEGQAPFRDNFGRELATKKILIYKQPMLRLASALDSMAKQFKQLSKRDRKNPDNLLYVLQVSLASSLAGNSIRGDQSVLKQAKKYLPLTTKALDVSLFQLQTIASDEAAWKDFVDQIGAAAARAQSIVDKRNGWNTAKLPDAHNPKEPIEEQWTLVAVADLP